MDLKKKSQTMDMTKGSPTSLLLRFAMPLFLGNLLQQFYNLVDTSIAGNLGWSACTDWCYCGVI